jgi:hypothetical protein
LRENVVERGAISCAQTTLEALHGTEEFNRALAELRLAPHGVRSVIRSHANSIAACDRDSSATSSAPFVAALAPVGIDEALHDARAAIDRLAAIGDQLALHNSSSRVDLQSALATLREQIDRVAKTSG